MEDGNSLPFDSPGRRPRRRQLGMIEMKRLTIELDPLYARDFQSRFNSRHGWLGYLYELFNFSNGERSLEQITRALSHEIAPIELNILDRMCCDLERLGYLDYLPAPDPY